MLLLKGFSLGWSVAWPPGPVNAEMLRRCLERGFLPAWAVGLGACTADFGWALVVSIGAGAAMNVPGVRSVLGVVSVALLLFLAWTFGCGAWRAWCSPAASEAQKVPRPRAGRFDSTSGGYLLGLSLALASPWNIAFWLAVIGSQAGGERLGLRESLTLAAGVTTATVLWGALFCWAVRMGARFATPAWHVVTQGGTALLMLYFAVKTILGLTGHA